jgi:hypothetical protein
VNEENINMFESQSLVEELRSRAGRHYLVEHENGASSDEHVQPREPEGQGTDEIKGLPDLLVAERLPRPYAAHG